MNEIPKSSTKDVIKGGKSSSSAQNWLSKEFIEEMKNFSEISAARRELVADAEGKFATRMTQGLEEQQGDVVESLAPIIMAAMPGSPIAKLFVADVIIGGSSYDKNKKRKRAA
jgi:hexokinase